MSDLYLFRAALWDLLRPKKILTALFLVLFPVVFAVLIRFNRTPEEFNGVEVYNNLTSVIVFQFTMIILALVFATGTITQEVEQKTIVYLMTRPIPRWRILLMKFLASTLVTVTTVWITCGLLSLVCFGGSRSFDAYTLRLDQINDQQTFITQFKETPSPYLLFLVEKMPTGQRRPFRQRRSVETLRQKLEKYDSNRPPEVELVADVIANLNSGIRRGTAFDKASLLNSDISEGLKSRIQANPEGLEKSQICRDALQELMPNILEPAKPIVNPVKRDMAILPVGAFTYGAVFLLLATFLSKPLIYGLMFAFAWETWVPNMPGNFQKLSLMSYLKILAPHERIENGMNPSSILAQAAEKVVITAPQAAMTLALVTIIALGAALYTFSVREYVPREDAS